MLTQTQAQVHTGWMTAAPLWDAIGSNPTLMQRPALLRFASDNFMDDLQKILETSPQSLANFQARKESFRARPSGAPSDWQAEIDNLKLYQPIHGHFYLIAASLICRIPGLPDRTMDTANKEKASFVLRRYNTSDGSEMAWINDPIQGKGWQRVQTHNGDYNYLAHSEELLPMFPMNFSQNGRKRRLLVGLIPTSSRESYKAAPQLPPLEPMLAQDDARLAKDPEGDSRLLELEMKVNAQFQALKQSAFDDSKTPTFPDPNLSGAEKTKRKNAKETQEQDVSRFILLDLAEFISKNLPDFWQKLNGKSSQPLANGPEKSIYNILLNRHIENSNTPTLLSGLITASEKWAEINREIVSANSTPPLPYNLKHSDLSNDELQSLMDDFKQLLKSQPQGQNANPKAPLNADMALPKLDSSGATMYIMRCVFQRPNCGPFQPELVSNRTQEFALAPFFDFDAPARPIRISLPVDTSIAGLRKFNKNVGFLISNQLREQMERATDLKKAMDGNLASGEEFDLGTLCSFSIPIITICALMILMIFISLLNFVFWWIPLLKICLPIGLVNKLKGK